MLRITLLSDNILKILSGLIPIACKVQWHFLHLINHCNYSMPRKDADPRKGFSHLVSKNVPSLISVTSPKRFTSGEQPSHSTEEEETIKSWTNSESKLRDWYFPYLHHHILAKKAFSHLSAAILFTSGWPLSSSVSRAPRTDSTWWTLQDLEAFNIL